MLPVDARIADALERIARSNEIIAEVAFSSWLRAGGYMVSSKGMSYLLPRLTEILNSTSEQAAKALSAEEQTALRLLKEALDNGEKGEELK